MLEDMELEKRKIVYDAKWSIFVNWCVGRELDPIKVSVQQLADLFVYLFEDKDLFLSTINGYRSSITRTLAISTFRRVTKRADVGSLNLDALFFLSAERVDSL
jgi:hypothetical protein